MFKIYIKYIISLLLVLGGILILTQIQKGSNSLSTEHHIFSESELSVQTCNAIIQSSSEQKGKKQNDFDPIEKEGKEENEEKEEKEESEEKDAQLAKKKSKHGNYIPYFPYFLSAIEPKSVSISQFPLKKESFLQYPPQYLLNQVFII